MLLPVSPSIPPGQACLLAGIDKADRLRAWHVRDALDIGTADRAGARRLYTFGDVACLRVVNDLTNCGLAISLASKIAAEIVGPMQKDAVLMSEQLPELRPILVVRIEPEGISSQIVWGNSGEGGVEALRQAAGTAMVVVYDLGASINRTQRAYEAYSA